MNKKLFFIANFIFLLFFAPITSFAKLPVEYGDFIVGGKSVRLPIAELEIDGQMINSLTVGVDPVTINSRTLVPVRALSEKLDYHVTWIENIQKVTIEKSGKKIELFVGKTTAKIDNVDVTVTDSVAPTIINSSTYVPIRFVVENMGLKIDYDAKLNKITLNSNGLEDLLFDEKTQIDKEDKGAVSNNSNIDLSVPTDVDRFVIKESTRLTEPLQPDLTIKPAEPERPILPDNTSSSRISAKYEVYSSFSKTDNEIFTIIQDKDEIDVNYFYLSSPKRLVVDVKNADLVTYENGQRQLNGATFLSVNSLYNSDSGYTRFSIFLNQEVNNSDIKITKDKNILKIEQIEVIKQGEEFKYNFDRKNGSIDIKLSKNIDIQNSSRDSSMIELKLPKDSIKLNIGDLNISNRIISSLSVSEEENNYLVKMKLSERVSYNINKLSTNSFRITFTKKDRAKPLIVIDPGHGGKDAGAVNKEFNTNEKTLNIQVANKLNQKLANAGYEVVMTRYDDIFVPLNDIASFSNSKDPDIFISIHHNSVANNPNANGIETFYHSSSDSKKLADIIQKELISYSKATNRGVKSMPFVVIKKTQSPAVLLELGFMSNSQEVQKNMSDSYQELLCDAITSAINIYFGK